MRITGSKAEKVVYCLEAAPQQPKIDLRRSVPLMYFATAEPYAYEDRYENIDMPCLSIGRRVPAEEQWRIPNVVVQRGRRQKFIPLTMTPTGQWIVSQTFKDIVESLDGDTHQFFPVTIVNEKDGKPYDEFEARYFWNNCVLFSPWELFDVEKTEAKGGKFVYEEKIRPDNGQIARIYKYRANMYEMVIKTATFFSKHFCIIDGQDDKNNVYHSIIRFFLVSRDAQARLKTLQGHSVAFVAIESVV
jgi:hypothetical protein